MRIEPRSSSGTARYEPHQSCVDRSISASTPDAGGKTSFTRLSYTSPGVPSSLSSSPPRVTRTNDGETRETARTSARVRM